MSTCNSNETATLATHFHPGPPLRLHARGEKHLGGEGAKRLGCQVLWDLIMALALTCGATSGKLYPMPHVSYLKSKAKASSEGAVQRRPPVFVKHCKVFKRMLFHKRKARPDSFVAPNVSDFILIIVSQVQAKTFFRYRKPTENREALEIIDTLFSQPTLRESSYPP